MSSLSGPAPDRLPACASPVELRKALPTAKASASCRSATCALAANAFGATAHGSVLLAAVDARMNEVYCAVYRRDEHEREPHARAAACARTDRR